MNGPLSPFVLVAAKVSFEPILWKNNVLRVRKVAAE